MDRIKCKKWLVSFGVLLIIYMIVISLITYLVDPFFQFRVRDNEYMLNNTYVTPGLVKNYDYDTVIVGSSMTQNFDMDYIKERLDCNPLKGAISGMSSLEMRKMLELVSSVNKAENCYVCLDLLPLTNDVEIHCPEYLFEDGIFAFMKYSFSYESLLRYIPIDVGLKIIDVAGVNLPESVSDECNINRLGYWGDEYEYSEGRVVKIYKNSKHSVSSVDTNNLQERMKNIIDKLFETVEPEEREYTFFFPPYSSLFWHNAQNNEYFETFMWAKNYIYQKADKIGCKVFDFQSAEFTMNLDNYRDTTHYKPEINDWMVDCFDNGDYAVTSENRKEFIDTLRNNTEYFVKNNPHIFE